MVWADGQGGQDGDLLDDQRHVRRVQEPGVDEVEHDDGRDEHATGPSAGWACSVSLEASG